MRWFLLLLTLISAGSAHALQSPAVSTDHGTATLVSEADSYRPGALLRLGLRLTLQPGWHTYWSNPGDAGSPPTIDIAGAQAGAFAFPTPTLLREGGFTSYVYTGEVLLPFTVTAPKHGGPWTIAAHANWLACAQICVPEEAQLTLTLPQGDGAKGADQAAFQAADAASPRPSPFPAHIAPDGTLTLAAPSLAPVKAVFFPAEAGVIDQDAAQSLQDDASSVSLRLKPIAPPGAQPHVAGILQLTDRSGRTEALWVDATPFSATDATVKVMGLLPALGLALLGGLILNLMPCVLPVLAMKAMAVTRLAGAQRSHVRQDALWYSAGILTAFAVIGGATLAIGAAGGGAGWGMQFQSTVFTAAMAWLMLAVGLNFFGVFEIGASAAGVGQGLAARGAFGTGLLAVVVATPCSAPFMATALAAAFALPAWEGMAVFLALGLGLAAPYGVLALAPGLARFLPRPGVWMNHLRRVLALPMFGAALWLCWVVWRQSGTAGLALALGGACFVALACVARGRAQLGHNGALTWPALAGAAAIAAGIALLTPSAPAPALVAGAEPYSEGRLAALRGQGHPVLVDMSAAWCITCLVNERVALEPAEVRRAFHDRKVALLVGDWTRRDPDITAFLQRYGRNGVPLYVYFPPGNRPAEILPQILTAGEVLGRLGA